MTIAEIKKKLAASLSETSPSPQLDADCILQHVLGCDRTQLLLRRCEALTAQQEAAVTDALAKRRTGLPIAYITGYKEFFGYDFAVSPAVLIPKPDTELLVELALAAAEDRLSAHPGAVPTVCDMCTGSGCVGISLLRALSEKGVSSLPALTLADISTNALDVARTNARRLLPPETRGTVHFVQSNLFENIPHTFDIIATNPPYVPRLEARTLLTDGRSEPLLALDGDVTESGDSAGSNDGLALIRRLVPQAYDRLPGGGVLLMETGEYNAEEAAALCEEAGFRKVHIERDLCGQLRVVCGVR